MLASIRHILLIQAWAPPVYLGCRFL